MSKASSIPEHIDAPNASYFAIGVPSYEKPFDGNNILQVIRQDFASISGDFPEYGEAHPDKSSYSLFHRSPEQHLGGGILKSTCHYAYIQNTYTKDLRQSVNFYGVRQREITFQESYKTIKRISRQSTQVINGTLFLIPYVESKEVIESRNLKAFNIVAREPFSEEVTCTQHVQFYNTAKNSDYEIKERLLVKDKNTSIWRKQIDEAYEEQKHEHSVKIGAYPQDPEAFSSSTGTNYLSESSNPTASWYAGKIGNDDYIVQPTNVEPFLAGTLIKVDWITTKYR